MTFAPGPTVATPSAGAGPVICALAVVAALATTAGCSSHHDVTIDGPYHLTTADKDDQMSVCYDSPSGCIGRIPPTVYAVGVNADYVVAARHPGANRDIVEYYYVIRAIDTPTVDTSTAVQGPFDAQAFDALRIRLQLPVPSYEIARLK